jgi:hypothetical protein
VGQYDPLAKIWRKDDIDFVVRNYQVFSKTRSLIENSDAQEKFDKYMFQKYSYRFASESRNRRKKRARKTIL